MDAICSRPESHTSVRALEQLAKHWSIAAKDPS